MSNLEKEVVKIREELSELLVAKPLDEALVLETLDLYNQQASGNDVMEAVIREEIESNQTLVELAIWANSLPIVKALVELGASLKVESINSGNEIEGDDKSMVALARHVAGEGSALHKFVSETVAGQAGGRRSRKNRRSHKNNKNNKNRRSHKKNNKNNKNRRSTRRH